ncbi:MAG: hypothetical protein K0S79_533 [Nitrospira sp.]|nr:hypothetical protein [Nitrospira sp.]
MVDQEMVGNHVRLHARNPIELLQCLDHRVVPLTAILTNQCKGRAFKGECSAGRENNAHRQNAGHEDNARHGRASIVRA